MASKYLFLTKGITSHNGVIEDTVYGSVKVFLKNIFGTSSPIRVNSVNGIDRNGQPVTRNVTNVEGSYKVDELMARQLKFYFDVEIPKGDFINIRVALWGVPGDNLAKFNINEGDLYMFMLRSISLESFSRRNNTTGYQLSAQAFDFDVVRSKKADENGAAPQKSAVQKAASVPAQDYSAPAVQKAAPVPVQDYSADDFAAIDDSDDLPF